ncbi:tetratricopeptide repeat protein 28-like [Stylophora pistillata]|uniref:tetratricopeptide repeat protein 28-like n=1 Tax=Stylophora pistillata TaxID=50429 RepID=UPI000C03CBC2|nr:tetratricopeptide repeat protein 28-like [Stylophora pistillata]
MSNWGTSLKFRIARHAGDFLFHRHMYHKAIDMYKEAQVLLNKLEFCNYPKMCLHYQLARSYVGITDFKGALENYKRLLQVNEEVGNKDWEVLACSGISQMHRLMGQPVPSIFFLRKVLEIAKETEDKRAAAEVYLIMGDSYYNLGKSDKFIECHNDALKICREIGDRQMEGQILAMLGSKHKNLAHYQEAIKCLEKSLEIFREMGRCENEGESYQALGMTYHEMGDFGKALEYHFKSLELMMKHGEEVGLGVSYNNIGTTYQAICKYSEALEYFKKTHEIMGKWGNKITGKVYHGLGLCYTTLGQFADAIKHLIKAVEILEETGLKFEMGRALTALGGSYNTIGQHHNVVAPCYVRMEKFPITCSVADCLFNNHLHNNAMDISNEAQVLSRGSKVENRSDSEISFNFIEVMPSDLYLLSERLERARRPQISEEHGWNSEALESDQRPLQINEECGGKSDSEVTAYKIIILKHHLFHQHTSVIFFSRQLLQIAKENGDKQSELQAYLAMGYSYYVLGKPDASIEWRNNALEICREMGNKNLEGQILRELGSAYKDLANYSEAIRCLEESLEISNKLSKFKVKGESYQGLGMTYHAKGDYDKALECHFNSLELMTEHGDEEDVGVSFQNIGTTYTAISKNCEALDYFKRSLKITKKCGIKTTAEMHHNLGVCYSSFGQYAKAIEHQVQAVNNLEKTGKNLKIGRATTLLGNLYIAIGNIKEAMNSFQKAIKCSETTGDRRIEANAYRGLGVCLASFDQGEEYLQKALNITKETGDKIQKAMSYSGLGFCCMSCGRFTESLDNFEIAISIMREIGAESELSGTLINAGSAYRALGKLKKAKELHEKALEITRKIGDKGKEQEALHSLGICYRELGELKRAHDCFSESITCAEKNRKLFKDEHKLSLDNITFVSYDSLCSLRISQGNFSEALCAAERGRARALGDLLSVKYGLQRNKSHELYLESISNLCIKNQSTIIFMAKPLKDKNIHIWVLQGGEIQLQPSNIELRETSIKVSLNLSQNQPRVVCEDRSLSAYYRMQPSPQETKENREQRRLEEADEEEKDDSNLYELYKNCFAPVADLVQCRDVIIAPQGDLFMVPFCALRNNNDKFLSETFRIRLIPSLTALRMIQDSPTDYHCATGALIVGNPSVPSRTKLPSLPGARREAMEIAGLLGVSATLGDEATKRNVLRRIQDVSLIHIAAHGDAERGEIALASNCPFQSRLRLRKEDFMLTMEDVAKVGIRAKLVVLSCCHSGKGQIMKSEGVVGISRAFLAAGARSVLVSLWAVDDLATKEFMIRFYGHLKRDKLSASEALQHTIKWMRESKRFRVKDWAAFVLIGDDVTLDF